MRRPRPKTYLIDQDQHLQNIRKIIKRDFFSSKQQKQANIDQTIPLGLNDYMKNFKSNQNQIFSQLVQANAQQWRKKYQWMQKSKQLMIQSGKNQKPYTNMICKDPNMKAIDFSIVQQDPKNAVFFSPSRQTKSKNDIEHDKLKKLYPQNCRIQQQQIQRAKKYEYKFVKDPNLQEIPSTPILQGRHKKRQSKIGYNKNQTQDYSIKRAPSPQPQKIPIMTWGQIQSTPMRISQLPEYKIPQVSKRDKLLDELTSKIVKQKISKINRKDQIKLKLLSSVRVGASSIRKPSIARQNSQVRKVIQKGTSSGDRLDGLLNPSKK